MTTIEQEAERLFNQEDTRKIYNGIISFLEPQVSLGASSEIKRKKALRDPYCIGYIIGVTSLILDGMQIQDEKKRSTILYMVFATYIDEKQYTIEIAEAFSMWPPKDTHPSHFAQKHNLNVDQFAEGMDHGAENIQTYLETKKVQMDLGHYLLNL